MILWRMQGLQYTHLYYFSTSDKSSKALLQTNYTLCELLLKKNMWGNWQERQQAHFTSSEFKSISARRLIFQSSIWFCSSSCTKLAVYCSATTSKAKGGARQLLKSWEETIPQKVLYVKIKGGKETAASQVCTKWVAARRVSYTCFNVLRCTVHWKRTNFHPTSWKLLLTSYWLLSFYRDGISQSTVLCRWPTSPYATAAGDSVGSTAVTALAKPLLSNLCRRLACE